VGRVPFRHDVRLCRNGVAVEVIFMQIRTRSVWRAAILALTLTLLAVWAPRRLAQPSNQVGLVVSSEDGSYTTRCVTFTEQSISGYEVLMRSGLDVVTADGLVCDIEGESGCEEEDCLCDPSRYWGYWHLVNEGWTYSTVGANAYAVQDGDVEGWRWGAGEPPPVVLFDDICHSSTKSYRTFLPLVLRQRRSP
jgi:hypothetical protein